MKLIKKSILLTIHILVIKQICYSQDSLKNSYKLDSYGFENIDADTFFNAKQLNKIFDKLNTISQTNNGKFSIIHLGDSHLQADFISQEIRESLQKKFGNAGRGLITPLKLAKSNEPYNYSIRSEYIWENKKIVSRNCTIPIGLGGVCISCINPEAEIQIQTKNVNDFDYSFKKLIVFHPITNSNYNIILEDTTNHFISNLEADSISYTSMISLPFLTNSIFIKSVQTDTTQKEISLYGVSLENDKSGVLHHTIGINGAKYSNFNKHDLLIQQTNILNPDLFIISLGTNEAFDKNYSDSLFIKTIDTLLIKIKKYNPSTTIILTTPANSFYYHKKNQTIPLIASTIKEYALKNEIVLWDLYHITGGENSAISWRKHGLLSKDGVHYTKKGYTHQGKLFTFAFLSSYTNYIEHRSK